MRVPDDEETTAKVRDWRDRQHKARQQGPKEDLGQALFDSLNLYCQSHRAWLISPPGIRAVMIEAPAGSNVKTDLADMGFRVSSAGYGSRLVSNAGQANLERDRYKPERLISVAGEIQTELIEVILPKT